METMLKDGVLENCRRVGAYTCRGSWLKAKTAKIKEVRGRGLLVGVELTEKWRDRDGVPGQGISIDSAGTHVLRFVPPLIITEAGRGQSVEVLDEALGGSMKKDLFSFTILSGRTSTCLTEKAALKLKLKDREGSAISPGGKTLGMIFEKSSTRTRISFEVGMYQLGGMALYLNSRDTQIGRGEIIADTARIMSRYSMPS